MKYSTRRFLISITIAVGIHFLILFLALIMSRNIEEPKEYKPLTVEISFERSEYKKTESKNVKINNESTVNEKKFTESKPQAKAVQAKNADDSQSRDASQGSANADASKAKEWKPAQEVPSYAAEEPDDRLIELIKSNTSDTAIDAESLFGDEPIPASDNQGIASGTPKKTGIVESDTQIENKKEDDSKGEQSKKEESILDEDLLNKLDKDISSAGSSGKANQLPIKDESNIGNGSPGISISFDDPANKRRLLLSPPPDIPDEVKTNGKPKYIVILDFYIDSDGFISNINFKKNSTDSGVDAAVSKALRGWLFEGTGEGDTKKVKATLTYIIEIK